MADIRLNDLPFAPTPNLPDSLMWVENDIGGGTYISYKTSVKQTNSPVYLPQVDAYTAESGDRILPDNSSAPLTINLPASPSAGDAVYFRQVENQLFFTNPLTVGRNGNTIMGLAEDMIVQTPNLAFHLVYNGSTWVVYKDEVVGEN